MNTSMVLLGEILLMGIVFLVLPRIARRGLLFGVYVGEERWEAEEVRSVIRGWNVRMLISIAAGLAACLLSARASDHPAVFAVGLVVSLVGFVWSYATAHLAARKLAVAEAPPAVASLDARPATSSLLPIVTLVIAAGLGSAVVGFAVTQYDAMPERIPVHFDGAGSPDAWSDKSWAAVMFLPLMTLIMGVFLGLFAYLTAHAKRSLRHPDRGVSVQAQERFRLAISRFLCAMTLLVTGMLALISYGQVQVARGVQSQLTPWVLAFAVGITAFGIGGAIYLMVRYGQGGSRLEAATPGGALTNGLADNRLWKWGVFYINRDDPSILVEKRFGFGYTINFGNPWAVMLLAGFLVLVLGLVLVSLLAQ